ncbi:MAG: hypothetical protein KAW41_00935 [Candidatus Diapherotrites archaeon]|nr:hypothetical protein [Candidatus Diapherotrites archaeon]
MARTPQWIKNLGGHAGELYVAAELSKRGIPNALLPENFSDDDILIAQKDGSEIGYIQVKSCHPNRSDSFILRYTEEEWTKAKSNEYVVLVYLGTPEENESPRYWITTKKKMGKACVEHGAHGTKNWERRFWMKTMESDYKKWENNWGLFKKYLPK